VRPSLPRALLRQFRHSPACRPPEPLSDRELLDRFVTRGDQAALAGLVGRHGPLVLAACRRLLPHAHDAEDVFQATFLVLARRAGAIRSRQAVGSWLYGVAVRLARRLRADEARRRRHERAAAAARADLSPGGPCRESQAALDEELARLSEPCRAALLACCLDGLTQEQAALRLGCSLSSVRRLLDRGRALLRVRLTRRGLTLPAVLTAAALPPGFGRAAVPARLFGAAVQAARVGAGAAVGGVPPAVLALAAAESGAALSGAAGRLAVAAALLLGPLALAAATGAQPGGRAPLAPHPARQEGGRGVAPVDTADGPLPPGARLRLGSPRLRHAGAVGPVAFSPGGKLLATGGRDGTVRVWDAATGRQSRLLLGHRSDLVTLAFSADGKRLASGSAHEPDRLRLWDLTTGKQLWAHRPPGRHALAVAFSADGKAVALGNDEGLVVLLDAATGKERTRLQGHPTDARALAFSPDGRLLAACADHGPALVWNLAARKEVLRVEPRRPAEEIRAVHFSPDARAVRVSGLRYVPGDGALRSVAEVRVFATASGKALRTHRYDPAGTAVAALGLSPDGRTGAAACFDGAVHLWDVATGKRLRAIRDALPRPSPNERLVFSPDGRILAIARADVGRAVRLWDVATGRAVQPPDGHEALLRAVAVSPDGTRIATGGDDRTARLWDAATGKALHTLPAGAGVLALAFSPDGRTLAVGGAEEACLWDARAGKPLGKLRAPSHSFTALAFTPDGKSLVTGHARTLAGGERDPGMPGSLRVWDVATGRERRRLDGPPLDASNSAPALRVTPDGREVLALHADQVLRAWRPETGKARALVRAAGPGVRLLAGALSADGTLFAGNAGDGPFRAWDLARGSRPVPLAIPDGYGQALAFSPDNRYLATAGTRVDADAPAAERTVRLWELATGKEAFRLPLPPGNAVSRVAFLPGGRSLAAAMADTTVLVWDLAPAGGPRPDAAGLGRLWADLGGEATAAYRAARRLASCPAQAVPFLAVRLPPAAEPDPEALARLLGQLDHKAFAARDRAERELERLGDLAAPALRQALAKGLPLEVARRVKRVLAKLEAPAELSAAALREVRGVAVLEWAGTPAARKHLQALAGGASGARLTREARAALARLGRGRGAEP
jgi:RNA polymerase sigma factor (sigma-70 family)